MNFTTLKNLVAANGGKMFQDALKAAGFDIVAISKKQKELIAHGLGIGYKDTTDGYFVKIK